MKRLLQIVVIILLFSVAVNAQTSRTYDTTVSLDKGLRTGADSFFIAPFLGYLHFRAVVTQDCPMTLDGDFDLKQGAVMHLERSPKTAPALVTFRLPCRSSDTIVDPTAVVYHDDNDYEVVSTLSGNEISAQLHTTLISGDSVRLSFRIHTLEIMGLSQGRRMPVTGFHVRILDRWFVNGRRN